MVESVVAMPVGIYAAVFRSRMVRDSRSDYDEGRREFDAKNYSEALVKWDRAVSMMPSLRAYSDVEYWRGRAFEALGKSEAARTAYMDFLNYSERSTPEYFRVSESKKEPSWADKASDAEVRWALPPGH